VVKNRSLVGIITRSDILDFVLSGLSVATPARTNGNNKKTTSVGRRTPGKPRD
jgi:hypothetical protein